MDVVAQWVSVRKRKPNGSVWAHLPPDTHPGTHEYVWTHTHCLVCVLGGYWCWMLSLVLGGWVLSSGYINANSSSFPRRVSSLQSSRASPPLFASHLVMLRLPPVSHQRDDSPALKITTLTSHITTKKEDIWTDYWFLSLFTNTPSLSLSECPHCLVFIDVPRCVIIPIRRTATEFSIKVWIRTVQSKLKVLLTPERSFFVVFRTKILTHCNCAGVLVYCT